MLSFVKSVGNSECSLKKKLTLPLVKKEPLMSLASDASGFFRVPPEHVAVPLVWPETLGHPYLH